VRAHVTTLLLMLLIGVGQSGHAQELSQGQLRDRLLEMVKRDFNTHIRVSGLTSYIRSEQVPMNPVDRKFRDLVDKKLDYSLSTLEAKLLVRYPQHIPRIKIIKELSYSVTGRICQDNEGEGNETDSARHFIAGFSLALLAGEKFAHKYLTAHEGWILDHNLDEYTGYNFASGIMDLHNNVIGILAARKYQKSLEVMNLKLEVHTFSIDSIRKLAVQALKQARKENKLLAVYAKDGACSQLSQREKFRRRIGVSSETAIW
jgi:hypothetical protein